MQKQEAVVGMHADEPGLLPSLPKKLVDKANLKFIIYRDPEANGVKVGFKLPCGTK